MIGEHVGTGDQPKLIIFGAGGHSRSVLNCIDMNKFENIIILDNDINKIGEKLNGICIVGTDLDRHKFFEQGYTQAFIALGGTTARHFRKQIATLLYRDGYTFPVIVDRSAIISADVTVEEGSFIAKGVIVNCGAIIGKHSILNTGSIIEHDCIIGDYCHIAPGVCMSGNVTVGEQSHVGTGSSIRQSVRIGKNVTIGTGSVVVQDIPDSCVAYGNPCKVIHYE